MLLLQNLQCSDLELSLSAEKEHLTECSACHSQDFPADFSSSVAQVLKDSKTVIASIEDKKKEGGKNLTDLLN